MKHLSALIGGAVIGALVFGIWPEMWMSYGILGGWAAATILVSIGWYLNHWLGVIPNPPGEAWVDMGWAVGAAGVGWAMVRFYPDCRLVLATPTLLCCLAGGALGGVVAEMVKRSRSEPADGEVAEG